MIVIVVMKKEKKRKRKEKEKRRKRKEKEKRRKGEKEKRDAWSPSPKEGMNDELDAYSCFFSFGLMSEMENKNKEKDEGKKKKKVDSFSALAKGRRRSLFATQYTVRKRDLKAKRGIDRKVSH